MARVKRGTTANKRRKKILKAAKGFKWARKSKEKSAKEALIHAWTNAFRGRKEKKRTFRRLWNTKINAGARIQGITYGKLIDLLKKNNIKLDRKILADLAENEPQVFKKIIESVR